MLQRILTTLIMVPAVLAVVVFAPAPFYLAALGVVGSFCVYEYYRIMHKMGLRGQPRFGYAGFWILLIGLTQAWLPAAILSSCLLVAAFLIAMRQPVSMRDRVVGLMVNMLGVFYPAFCLYPAFAVRYRFGAQLGLEWTVTSLVVIWAGDTAALFAGRQFGRTPFAPRLSPKKTNEGAVAGLAAGVLAAVILRYLFFTDLPPVHLIATSLLIGAFGQMGDLAESMLKRAAEVKESSNLIPGHGGVLDRIDSLLFAFPVLCLYLQILYRP
jgi:phosphatidate cytidylyltransferase